MKDEYIIINKTAIQKRIEELEKTNQIQRVDELENVLSQSIPLIPEIKKAYDGGIDCGNYYPDRLWNKYRKEYITNLKLDI